jgi:hypothetical protein
MSVDYSSMISLNTSNNMESLPGNSAFNVSSAILQNATTKDTNQSSITINVAAPPNLGDNDLPLLPIFHFAEINMTNPNRRFDIYSNDVLMFADFSPSRFQVDSMYKSGQFMQTAYGYFFLNQTSSSSLPPLINALELYSLVPMDSLTTDSGDGKINVCTTVALHIFHVGSKFT